MKRTSYSIPAYATAIALAGVSAPISVMGMADIFTAWFYPIGIGLELSKLVLAGWLHARWQGLPRFARTVLTGLLFVLMVGTAIGIAGYLSRAYMGHHGDQLGRADTGLIEAASRVEAQGKVIDGLETQISEIKAAVNAAAAKGRANGSMAIRERARKERDALETRRQAEQAKLTELKSTLTAAETTRRRADDEAGSIKALASMLGVDAEVGKIVRALTLIIAVVFELLTIVLMMAAVGRRELAEPVAVPVVAPVIAPVIEPVAKRPRRKPARRRAARKPAAKRLGHANDNVIPIRAA